MIMKTSMLPAAFVLLIFCSAFSPKPAFKPGRMPHGLTASAVADGFDFFRTHRQGNNGITSVWGFTSATTVTGFKVERTYEDPADPYANWELVSAMPCTGARSYKCTDAGVFPGFISYRVTAVYAGGSQMVSHVSTVHIISH